MYLVKALRLFVGTTAERTAAGLAAFLPGDEYHETDTEDTYQHDGTAWIQKNTVTPPAGTDGQLQYNNGGAFGGSGAYWDDVNGRFGVGTATPGAAVNIVNAESSGTPETGLTVDNTYSPVSDPGSVFPASLSLLSDYSSAITPSGGFQIAQFLRVRNVGNGVMSARNLDIQYQNLGSGTVAQVTFINLRAPTVSGGGAITTAYGLKIENQAAATTNYAIYTDAGQVRFGDGVTIDTTTNALLLPRMTTTQQNALTAVNGMLLYNSTTAKVTAYAGGAWVALH